MGRFSIKKWRKEAMSMYGKARGLSAKARKAVTAVVKEKTYKKPPTKKRVGKREMGKKKNRRRSFFSTSTIFKWLRIASLVGTGVGRYAEVSGTPATKIKNALLAYGGVAEDGKFHGYMVSRMWLPFVATTLLTYGVQKLGGILRRF